MDKEGPIVYGNAHIQMIIVGKPKGWGARHTLTLLGFFGLVVCYSMRFNMSMAIVAMVNSTAVSAHQEIRVPVFNEEECPHLRPSDRFKHSKSNSLFDTDEGEDDRVGTPAIRVNVSRWQRSGDEKSILHFNETESGHDAEESEAWQIGRYPTFVWDEEEQGIILGAFFWGYCVAQLPGGYMGQRFGGKWPFGIGVAISAVFTLLTPFAAQYGKPYLITVRVIQGLAQGGVVPSIHGLLAQWLPVSERSRLSAIIFSGMTIGTAFITFVSGYIIHYFGWPSVFYMCGFLSLIWSVLWLYFVSNTPREHPTISDYELKYIMRTQTHQADPGLTNVPWKSVLTCVPFWGILLCISLETWGFYTLTHETPTYVKNILHFNIIQNSMLSTLPHLLSGVVTIAVTQLGDWLINKEFVSVIFVRKACTTIAFWGGAAAMIGVAYSGCNRTLTVTLLVLAMGLFGARIGGALINMIDIAPNYASILMGIVTTCGTISAYVAPWVAGLILKGNATLERWRIVFLLAAGICFLANLIYIITASGKEQEWNNPDFKKRREPSPQTAIKRTQRSGEINPTIDYRDAVILDITPSYPRNSA